jgi:hypothetical protein
MPEEVKEHHTPLSLYMSAKARISYTVNNLV